MNLEVLKKRLNKIIKLGYIQSHRIHDTGIGKTLEDLLGIKENNLSLPDFGELEIKAKRIDSDSMLTLATKSPLPKGINRVLFENYKYLDQYGSWCLHSTVYASQPNSQFFQIILEKERIVLKNKLNIEAFWPLSLLESSLKTKSETIFLVFAETKKNQKTRQEMFRFKDAYLLQSLNIDKIRQAIINDKLKIDIRIGCYRSGKYAGKYHDHGTAFRIHKRDFLHLYDKIEKII